MTALHKRCIQLITNHTDRRIRLASGSWFSYADAQPETDLGRRRIDVMLKGQNGRRLAVEICVTHPLTPAKISDLGAAGCPALEIRAALSDDQMTDEDLLLKLVSEIENKTDFGLSAAPTPLPVPAAAPMRSEWDFWVPIVVIVAALIWLFWYISRPTNRRRPRFGYRY